MVQSIRITADGQSVEFRFGALRVVQLLPSAFCLRWFGGRPRQM